MEQATQATTPTAPRAGTFAHAATIAAEAVGQLDPEPFSVHIDQDWPVGWRVSLVFRDDQASGLYALGSLLGAPVTESVVEDGIHLDVCTRVQSIEVAGTALVSPARAAELKGAPAPDSPAPEPATTDTTAAHPVPLGASVLGQVPAVTPIAVPGGDL